MRRGVEQAQAALDRKRAGGPWPSLVVLLGAGAGHAIDIVESDAPAATRILLLEPVAEHAAALNAKPESKRRIDSGRLRILSAPDYRGAADAWRLIDTTGGPPPLIVPDPELVASNPHAVLAARRIFDRLYTDAHENAKARRAFGGRYLVNTLQNVPRMLTAPDLRSWIGARKGAPAVVCGAGPSLNRNLEALAARRDRVVLIACDTALRPILEAGLEPDFVVALDSTPLNARHLSGLRGQTKAWLVAEGSLDQAAFESFDDRIAFFRVGGNDPWPWLTAQGVDVPVLAAFGSVLTSAFEFAAWLGCDPVMFMGADLAYSDGQPYCRGTMFEADWARIVFEGQQLPRFWQRVLAQKSNGLAAGVAGAEFPASPHLLAFRNWIVERSARSGRRVINLSGSGVLIGSSIQQDDAALLDRLPDISVTRDVPNLRVASAVDRELLGTAGAGLHADAQPMSGWISSCSPNIDTVAMKAALSRIGSSHDPCPATSTQPGRRALIGLPEAVAILRAATDRVAPPAWATNTPVWSYRQRMRTSPSVIVKSLLGMGRLGAEDAGPPAMTPVSGHLDLLFFLGLTQPALESIAALVIETADVLRARPARRVVSSGPQTACPESRVPGSEVQAQLLIASLWARANAAMASSDDRSWPLLIDAVETALTAGETDKAESSSALTLAVDDGTATDSWQVECPMTADRRADLLRGWLSVDSGTEAAVSRAAGGVRLTFATAGRSLVGQVPFRVLTDIGLPKCLIANPLGQDRAIVTPRSRRASFAVDASGRCERLSEWPHPITGEIHGPHGQMAWTYTEPGLLLFRASSTCDVISEEIAFQVYTGVWSGDRALLTGSDGVWSWQPGQKARHVAAVPPGVIVSEQEGVLLVDPLPLVNGRLERIALDVGWRVDSRTGAVSERRLPPPGQAWWIAARNNVEAVTFPEADAIRVSSGSGVVWLTVHRPRTAVWLGSSLLVNTTRGEVVLFEDLTRAIIEAVGMG
jgi:hypothetical protein